MVTNYSTANSEFECRLCTEIYDFDNSLFARTYPGALTKNAFLETAKLQVMIPIGPFCEGHVLVATKEHAWSFGHVSTETLSELASTTDKLRSLLRQNYSQIVMFEHGPMSTEQRGGCCLDHCHMNLLPIPSSLSVLVSASKFFDFTPYDIHDLPEFVEKHQPYLFFQSQEGSFAAPTPEGTTQFFRKLLASQMPGRTWDWRDNPHPDFIKATIAILGPGLKESLQ